MEKDPRTGGTGGGRENLRDWQKEDTWYGSFPVPENPFDEPEDAPELRDLRSEELNNRSGQFWESQTNGYRFGQERQGEDQTAPKAPPAPKKKIRKGPAFLLGLLGTAALALILNYTLFTVRTIRVEGTSSVPGEEVIRLSGLQRGTPILSLNTDRIERGIEQNPKLKFRYLKKDYPDTVVLGVREREECCWMTWNGILYTMDKQRYVLYESEILPSSMELKRDSKQESAPGEAGDGADSVTAAGSGGLGTEAGENAEKEAEARARADRIEADLVRVDGLKVRAGSMLGRRLTLESVEQQELFTALFLEMRVLSCTQLIREADLSSQNSVLLTTRDGFTVSLGDGTNIHAKLRAMLITREELLKRGYHGGVINVVLPENPIFSPAGT